MGPQVEVLFEAPGCTNSCSARPAPCSFRGPVDSFNLWIWVQLYRPPTGTDLEMLQASWCAAAQAVSVLLLKRLGHVLLLKQLGCRCCRQVGVPLFCCQAVGTCAADLGAAVPPVGSQSVGVGSLTWGMSVHHDATCCWPLLRMARSSQLVWLPAFFH